MIKKNISEQHFFLSWRSSDDPSIICLYERLKEVMKILDIKMNKTSETVKIKTSISKHSYFYLKYSATKGKYCVLSKQII